MCSLQRKQTGAGHAIKEQKGRSKAGLSASLLLGRVGFLGQREFETSYQYKEEVWWGGDSREREQHVGSCGGIRESCKYKLSFSLAVGGTLTLDKAGEVNWESQLEGYCMLKIMNLVSDVKETF